MVKEVVERVESSGQVSVASSLWTAAGVAVDGGDLSIDSQSSAGRWWIQQRRFGRQLCPRGSGGLGVQRPPWWWRQP
jgi:hypothetical protein